jgi:hypothetical protein
MREAVMTNFVATKAIQVPNQGPPPDSFIALLLAFGMIAGDYVFAFNENNDIFSIIGPILGTVDPQPGSGIMAGRDSATQGGVAGGAAL